MRKRPKGSAALKHGGYSGLTLLPGEDRFAFEKLRRQLFDELKPQGRLEQEIVTEIARLMWRKQNLGSYGLTQTIRILEDVLITSCKILSAQKDTEEFVKSADNYKVILEAKDNCRTTATETKNAAAISSWDVPFSRNVRNARNWSSGWRGARWMFSARLSSSAHAHQAADVAGRRATLSCVRKQAQRAISPPPSAAMRAAEH